MHFSGLLKIADNGLSNYFFVIFFYIKIVKGIFAKWSIDKTAKLFALYLNLQQA